jgi:D-alanyl-D-alanine carboxypeptidase (penicillin-binding protein 5/6)
MQERFNETRKLYDYGFNNFEMKTAVAPKAVVETLEKVKVKKGKNKTVPVVTKNDISFLVKKGTEPKFQMLKSEIKDAKELMAPLKKGTTVGTVQYEFTDENGKKLQKSVELITAEEVEKASWWRLMFRAIGSFFSGLFKGIVNLF